MSNYQGNMRGPGQKNRGRGGRPNNMMGGGNQGNRPRPPNRMQNFDSSGPSVKIRGNAYQVFERYIAMAREASSAGDRVAAENLYQHAEHYFRIMQANGEGQQNQMGGQGRPMTPADTEMNPGDMDHDGPPPQPAVEQPQQPQQLQPAARTTRSITSSSRSSRAMLRSPIPSRSRSLSTSRRRCNRSPSRSRWFSPSRSRSRNPSRPRRRRPQRVRELTNERPGKGHFPASLRAEGEAVQK